MLIVLWHPVTLGEFLEKLVPDFRDLQRSSNWTLIFSLSTLKDIIPHCHFECWHYFVKACYLISQREISVKEVEEADDYLDLFCKKFEKLYSKQHGSSEVHS